MFVLLHMSNLAQEDHPFGFEDTDRNGINDHFADANGDGVNDVDGQPYTHNFKFEDKDKDGKNDL